MGTSLNEGHFCHAVDTAIYISIVFHSLLYKDKSIDHCEVQGRDGYVITEKLI